SLRLPERLPAYLRETEAVDLFQKPIFTEGFEGHTERLMLELFYQVGLRRNELLTMKESNVEWSLKQLRVLGKGNKERLIPVKAELLVMLQKYLHEKSLLPKVDEHHLLVLPTGEPLYAMYVYRKVKHFLTQITTLQKRSPHVLRHTFATHLLNNGANIQAIKDLLGHSSLAATQIYTHTNIEKLKEIHKLNHPRG
ncbi:MAG: tyrosine-type recombinase/integrase, partial [Bacteroidetes bacterium]|nr:tyrosine-type recombinase/integrase [Bacteroidota bacterium]